MGIITIGCSTNIPIVPNAPIPSESALSDLTNTQDKIEINLENNKKINEQIRNQERTIYSQKIEIQEALSQAENIRGKVERLEEITSEETFILVEQLKKVQNRNLFLEKETEELLKLSESQMIALEETKSDAREAMKKLILVENELRELRYQHDYLSKNLIQKNDEVLKLSKNLSSAKVYKNWIIGGIIFLIVIFILGIVLFFTKKTILPF